MSEFLKAIKQKLTIINEVEEKLNSEKTLFENIKIDYIAILLYANFEQDLNKIIENKLQTENNFNNNYIRHIKIKNQKLHRGISQKPFKELIINIFNKQRENIIDGKDWNIFCAFMDFRHSIAHQTSEYEAKKQALISNMETAENLVRVFEEILSKLEHIKNIDSFTSD